MEDELLDNKLKNIILILQQQKRTQHQIKMLEEMTLDVPFFQQYRKDGKDFIHKRCCALMGYEYIQKGEAAFHIDTFGDKFYIILKGTVGVYIKIDKGGETKETNNEDKDKQKEKGEKKKESKKNNADKNEKKPQVELTCVKELKDGMSFGELALLQNKKRLASIICHSNCHVAILDKQSFVQVLGESEEQKILNEMQFFADFPFFEGWNFNLLKLLYLNSYLKSYSKGQYVFKEGTESSAVFFIKSGEFEMFKQFNYDNVMHAREEPLTSLDIGGDKNNKSFIKNQTPELKSENSKSPKNNSVVQPDQIVEKQSRKKKSMGAANEKGKAITFKDPLGKTIKLCILTQNELFGEEDIIEGRRRTFGVRCVSFHGELIMIKQRDFQHRIMNDFRTKQLINQRLEQKKQMMDRKVNQLEKSMNLFSDYYFPKSNVINTINASTIPLFRKSFQNSKFQMSDKTFFYTQNINKLETIQPQLQQQQQQTQSQQQQQLNTSQVLVSQKSQRFDSVNSSTCIKDQPDLKHSQSTRNFTRQATIYNMQKSQDSSSKLPMTPGQKLLSQRSILLKSNENQDDLNGIENFFLDSPTKSSNLIQLGKGLSAKKNKSIQLQYISNKNVNDSDILLSPMVSSKPTNDIHYLGLVSPILRNKKESQTFKYDSPLLLPIKPSLKIEESNEKPEVTKNVSFRLISYPPEQEEDQLNHDLKENDFVEQNKSIELGYNQTPKKQQKLYHQDSLDEIIDKSEQQKESTMESSPQNQNSFNTFSSEQSKQQTKKEKKEYIVNDMTEGFYKSLRVNYLVKFKNQNVQNLKKHISSSLINQMPDKFIPLENSDLKKKRKKKESKFQFEDHNFLDWFKQQIKDQDKAFKQNRSRSQNSKERELKQNNNKYINQSIEKDPLSPSLIVNEENVNSSFHNNNLDRIHGKELKTRYSVVLSHQKKLSLSQDFVVDTDLIIENEPTSNKLIKDSGNNTPMKKNNSFTILRNITKPSNFTSRTNQNKNALQMLFSNDSSPTAATQLLPLRKSIIETPVNSKFLQSLSINQSQDKSMSSKLIQNINSPKKFNPIQNLYEMHQKKNDNSLNLNASLQRVDSKQNIHIPTEKLEVVEIVSPLKELFSSDTGMKKTKFEELKQLRKNKKQLSNIQQFLNTTAPKQTLKQSESFRSPKISIPHSPFNSQTNQLQSKQLNLPKFESSKSIQTQNNQLNLNSPMSPQNSFQGFFNNNNNNNNNSTNTSLFQTFKKMSERKVISKFEQQLYLNNNNNNSCSAVIFKQGNHV